MAILTSLIFAVASKRCLGQGFAWDYCVESGLHMYWVEKVLRKKKLWKGNQGMQSTSTDQIELPVNLHVEQFIDYLVKSGV